MHMKWKGRLIYELVSERKRNDPEFWVGVASQ